MNVNEDTVKTQLLRLKRQSALSRDDIELDTRCSHSPF